MEEDDVQRKGNLIPSRRSNHAMLSHTTNEVREVNLVNIITSTTFACLNLVIIKMLDAEQDVVNLVNIIMSSTFLLD